MLRVVKITLSILSTGVELRQMKALLMGGAFGPYRQSERKELYKKRIDELIEKKLAYYAFDSKEDLQL